MTDRNVRFLVIATAVVLLLTGFILFYIFDKLDIGKNKNNKFVNYSVSDYIEISPVVFDEYNSVYSSINVSRITIKNIDDDLTKSFVDEEDEILDYITGYYNEMRYFIDYVPVSTVNSTIKTQISGTVLSIFYKLDFDLDENIFSNDIKSYMITYNIDLGTNKVLTNEDLLIKYDYSKEYIADKLFNEDVLIEKGQVVIDKTSNISLIRIDIERKKEQYVDRIIKEFDNIIVMYIDNGSLTLVYDTKDLKEIFFDNEFNTDIKFRYLK